MIASLALSLLVTLAPLPLPAAPPQDGGGDPAVEAAGQDEPFAVPATVAGALEVGPAELARGLEERSVDELTALLGDWMARLDELEVTLAAAPGGSDPAEASARSSDRDVLLDRAAETLAALEAAGGHAPGLRARLTTLHSTAEDLEAIDTAPANLAAALELDVEVLRALLRPMRLAQVEQQLGTWLQLLQEKSTEVTHAEVRALRSEDPDEIARINERAVEIRAQRARLIERSLAVIDAVEEKGGDVEEARRYVGSIVVTPPVTGWRAAWSTALAWLRNPDGGIALGLHLALALGILLATWVAAFVVGRLVRAAMQHLKGVSVLLKTFAERAARRIVLLLGVLMALAQLGVSMGPWMAAIGAAGLVIGLALQGTLSNFASGILIMVYRPFDVGDVIATDGPTGKVHDMSLVSTTIRTFDNQTIHVPNNTVWNGVITNITANDTRRVDMVFGIGYDDDVDQALELLRELLEDHEKTLDDPAPNVRVHELGDSSVNLIARPWVKTEDYWDVYWDLTREAKRRFDAAGITIPYPQRDVHLIPAGPSTADPRDPASAESER